MTTASARPDLGRELGLSGLAEIALGYERAQVLLTANELGLFDLLSGGGKTVADVATTLGTNDASATALLDACVALNLLRSKDGRYENSRTAALFLRKGGAGSFAAVLRFWREFSYGPWGRLAEAVLTNCPQTAVGPKRGDLFDALLQDPAQSAIFFDGLAGLAYWPAQRMAELVDFGSRHHMLDVGGGSGAFSTLIAQRHAHLKVTLFDLEPVCVLARRRFDQVDSSGRLTAVGGDFHQDDLPRGADCVLLSNVLHDWSTEECLALLGRVHAALPPGGEVIVNDFMPVTGTPQLEAALFSLALRIDTNRGRVYTIEELEDWLHATGFEAVTHHDLGVGTGILTAVKTS
jgi:ubiquinone/menaquinone biosynthesis C-methylase UbiE